MLRVHRKQVKGRFVIFAPPPRRRKQILAYKQHHSSCSLYCFHVTASTLIHCTPSPPRTPSRILTVYSTFYPSFADKVGARFMAAVLGSEPLVVLPAWVSLPAIADNGLLGNDGQDALVGATGVFTCGVSEFLLVSCCKSPGLRSVFKCNPV